MKQMLHRLYSIQFKLTVTFLLVLVPLVVVSLFANDYSQRIMQEQISDRTRGALLTTLEYVGQLTKNMDQQTLLISSNPNIVDIWREIADPLSPESLYDIRLVQQQLSSLTNVNGAIEEAYIVHGKSGNGVSTVLGGIKWPNYRQESWFQQVIEANGGLVTYIPSTEQKSNLSNANIYYARLLDILNFPKEPSILILAVNKSSFQSIIQHLQTTDQTNISLFYNKGLVLETNAQSNRASQNNRFMIHAESGPWSIQLEQPQAEIFQLSDRLKRFTYLIIVLSVILATWIAWLVYIQISKPLQRLSKALKQFSSGNLMARVQHRRKDEFGYVMDSFNHMAEAQRTMIEEDYEKELRLAKSEFSLLQSQINPHFLYNTLDSIYSVAMKYQIKEISEMVINLARFFRVSLGKGRDSFTLAETMVHLMYYIRVQQIRTDHFTTEIELEASTKGLPILKLLLQPIVENAIVHGLEKKSTGGELRIYSHLQHSLLYITIEDTGLGISANHLEEIQKELGSITSKSYQVSTPIPSTLFFGLKNVKSRIKLYYGEEADLLIDSEAGVGSKVTLILPIREDDRS